MIDVSVVVPCTDRTQGLQRCLNSVLSQDFSGVLEVIVVENNSQDRSLVRGLIENIEDARICHHYLDDCDNANVARNYGADQAQGRYVAYLDSDDEWLSNHVSECMAFCAKTSEVSAVFSGFVLDNGFNKKDKNSRSLELGETPYSFLFGKEKNVAQTSSYFMNTEVMHQCRWDETLKRNQDYDFFIDVQNKIGWSYLGRLTTVVHWDLGAKRTYSLESFKDFYNKHSSEMNDADRAFYLLEILKALATFSKEGFQFFRKEISTCRSSLSVFDRVVTYNFYLMRLVVGVKDFLRKVL